jgi:glucose-6-phosphate isomerase
MPKKRLLRFDYSLMMRAGCGANGKPEQELQDMLKTMTGVQASLLAQWKAGRAGFFGIPELKADLRSAVQMAEDIRRKFRTLVVIGIGGSDLGARAILHALQPERKKGMEVVFLGANTDPQELFAKTRHLDWDKTALNVISKSGDTIEPMSSFLVLRQMLIDAVGAKKHARHVVATTDRHKGTLRTIAEREGYRTLPVQGDIGGRFSALTPVGLFPAACAGLDVARLVAGAKKVRDDFANDPAGESMPLLFAGLQHDAYFRGGRITVLMPYAEALREFGFWFRQLWAESLGKKEDHAGRVMRVGFTPIAALGATDQHSQIQLYNEGPADKTVTFIEVGKFDRDFTVPAAYPDLDGVSYMGGHRLSAIIHAEREATARSLAKSGRPNATLHIAEVSPETLGGLMMGFMIATAAVAELLEVNAYDQPGVEEGKRTMYALLGRSGYSLD